MLVLVLVLHKQGYKKTIERQNALYSKRQWLMLLMMMPMSLRTNRSPYPGETELNPCALYTVLDCDRFSVNELLESRPITLVGGGSGRLAAGQKVLPVDRPAQPR